MIDAGDVGACSYDGTAFALLLVRTYFPTNEALIGWGGSGREGKGYPQAALRLTPFQFVVTLLH